MPSRSGNEEKPTAGPGIITMSVARTSPQSLLSRHRIWWQLATLLIITAIAVYVSMAFDREFSTYLPEYTIDASSFNYKLSGYSGLWELASKVGLNPHRFQSAYRHLPEIKGTLLIAS